MYAVEIGMIGGNRDYDDSDPRQTLRGDTD